MSAPKVLTGFAGNFLPAAPVTIALGAAISSVITTNGLALAGIKMPAAFTGTSLSFKACDSSDGTFLPVYNAAGLVAYPALANQFIAIDPKDFQGIQFLQILSNATELAARSFSVALKGL